MKLLSTLFFVCFFSFISLAQITINPEVIVFETPGPNFEIKPEVINNTEEFSEIYWMFEKGENFPGIWSVVVCDDTLCYAPNIFKSSALFPNYLEADSSFEFKFTVTTGGIGGSSYGILHLYDDADCNNEVATSMMPTNSVGTENLERATVYPNPAKDHFSIKDDENVSSIEIFNNVGQSVMKQAHHKDQSHSISTLPYGVYVVVLRNSEREIVRSLQLHKE